MSVPREADTVVIGGGTAGAGGGRALAEAAVSDIACAGSGPGFRAVR